MEVNGSTYRGAASIHVELGEDVLGVRAQRVHRDVQVPRDLRPAELGRQQAQDIALAFAELVVSTAFAGCWRRRSV